MYKRKKKKINFNEKVFEELKKSFLDGLVLNGIVLNEVEENNEVENTEVVEKNTEVEVKIKVTDKNVISLFGETSSPLVEKNIVKKKILRKKKVNNSFKLFSSNEAKVLENYFTKRYGVDLKDNEFSPNVYENLVKLYKTKIDKLDYSKGKEHRYERETVTKFDRCKLYV